MIRVFRVEHPGDARYDPGDGPYAFPKGPGPNPQRALTRASTFGKAREALFSPRDGWRYAFRSPAQYKRWFTPEQRQVLKEDGFKLRSYDVPRAALVEDSNQAAFDPKVAVAIARAQHPAVQKLSASSGRSVDDQPRDDHGRWTNK